jgi:hypothetical protein
MYIIPNMIIYRHHANWPTYNTKNAKINAFSFSKNAQHFATENASNKRILGNKSNIDQKNDLYLPEFSLRNAIRKPSYRAHGQVNNDNTAIETSSLKTGMNEISRNLGKYFKAVSQITLHTLHCNLIMVLPKPKHVATLLKQ